MRNIALTPSLLFLIAVNLVPLFGVLTLGWDVATILVLYWLEGVVIGVLNIPKMIACQGRASEKLFLTPFFMVHYGIFAVAHAVFLIELIGADLSFEAFRQSSVLIWAALSFLLSHAVSMIINFIGKKEYETRKTRDQMIRPYKRVIIMHMVVLIGGVLVTLIGAPIMALIVLVVIKTGIDFKAHQKEHRSLSV